MPRVSVVVPVLDAGGYLRQCLDSVLRQTVTDLEVVCVDDGSTDGSLETLREYAARDPRLTVLTQPHAGAGTARNRGLDAVTGDFVAFLDADDFVVPTFLAGAAEACVRDDADLALVKTRYFDHRTGRFAPAEGVLRTGLLPPARPFRPADLGDDIFRFVSPAPWNKLFRRRFLTSHGLRFQEIRRANDVLLTRMALVLAERITVVDRYLVNYRTGTDTSLQARNHATPLEFVEALRELRAELGRRGLLPRLERAFVDEALSHCLSNLDSMATPEATAELYQALQGGLLAELGVLGRPREYFVRPWLYDRYVQVRDLPLAAYLHADARRRREEAAAARAEAARAREELTARAPRTVGTERRRSPQKNGAGFDPGGPLVSVVVPVYDVEQYLPECLDSVLDQTLADLEVICVDDGSSDSSAEILDQYAAQDPRLRVLHQGHSGLSEARNAGVAAARGRYLCFLDSDDALAPEALERLSARARADRLDVLSFDATVFFDDPAMVERHAGYLTYYDRTGDYPGVRPGPGLLADLTEHDDYLSSACLHLVDRGFYLAAGLGFQPGILHEDHLFTFRLLLSAERAGYHAGAYYRRRIRAGSIVARPRGLANLRGFFVTYLEMLRFVRGRDLEPRVAAAAGLRIVQMQRHAQDIFLKLREPERDAVAKIDPGADAQALYLQMVRQRHQVLRLRRMEQEQRRARDHAPPPGRRSMVGVGVHRTRRALRRAGRVTLVRLGLAPGRPTAAPSRDTSGPPAVPLLGK